MNFGEKEKFLSKKNVKYYEQENLQLNILKSKKFLNWQPKYSINKSLIVTADWYKKVLINKLSAEEITKKQIMEYMEID